MFYHTVLGWRNLLIYVTIKQRIKTVGANKREKDPKLIWEGKM